MTSTLIIAKNGKARPKNPYTRERDKSGYESYLTFEQSVEWHDCPEATEDGEFMGDLIWQHYNSYGRYWTDCSQRTAEMYCDGTETRQVWRIVSQPQEKKNMKKTIYGVSEHNPPMPDEAHVGFSFVKDQKEEAKTVEGKCVMGCKIFTGGEILHHKDCPFYPDSLSQQNKALMEENERLKKSLGNIIHCQICSMCRRIAREALGMDDLEN